MMFVIFVILLFFHKTQSLNFCEDGFPDNWQCVKNEDATVNLSLNCNLNKYKRIGLWLWNENFHSHDVRALTIENCEKLFLDLSSKPLHYPYHFTHLQISNVSAVRIFKLYDFRSKLIRSYFPNSEKSQNSSSPSLAYDLENKKYEDLDLWELGYENLEPNQREQGPIQLPPYVTIKNVQSLKSEALSFIRGDPKLKSFKIIETTIDELPENFLADIPGLEELIIDDSTILQSDDNAISLHNESAIIKITNSVMISSLSGFINCTVAKLIVTGNTFKELSKSAFKCEADEFVFSGNKIENLKSGFAIQSPLVNIHGNIIDYVGEKAFFGITAPSPKSKSNKTRPRKIFNCSKNEMHVLEPGALVLFETKADRFYDSYNVVNNSVNCSCQNMPWFYELIEGRYHMQKDHSFFTWVNKNNLNKCLNVPNCTLNQVIYNFFELCLDNYRCPVNISDDSIGSYHLTVLQIAQNYKDLANVDKEMSDSIKKMLEIAVDEREEKKYIFGNISTIFKSVQRTGLLNLTSNTEKVADEQGITVSLLILIASCLSLILALTCFVVLKGIKFINIPCPGNSRWQRINDPETEMDSRTSLVH